MPIEPYPIKARNNVQANVVRGPGSVVGIAIGYELHGPGIKTR
jgi:hypothetical protein